MATSSQPLAAAPKVSGALKTRVIAALIFTPAIAALVWFGGVGLGAACLVLGAIALSEFLAMTLGSGHRYEKGFAQALGLVLAWSTLGWPYAVPLAALWPATIILLMLALLARPEPLDASIRRASLMALGIGYCAGLFPYLARLRELEGGLGLALLALFCTWGSDTGAYFAGRLLGRHKLYPKVSPAKTVEGLIGGLVCAVVIALAIRHVFGVALRPADAVAIGAIAALLGTAGDLCESMLKRSVGAKDSSSLIPGHGGVLDRFDAVMFVAPAVYFYVQAFVPHP